MYRTISARTVIRDTYLPMYTDAPESHLSTILDVQLLYVQTAAAARAGSQSCDTGAVFSRLTLTAAACHASAFSVAYKQQGSRASVTPPASAAPYIYNKKEFARLPDAIAVCRSCSCAGCRAAGSASGER